MKRKSTHQTLETRESEEKGFLHDSKKPLALDHSTTNPKGHRPDRWVNIAATGRTEASLSWVTRSKRWHSRPIPRRQTGPRLVQSTADRLFIPPHQLPALALLRHQTCRVDSVFSSSHKTSGVSFHSCPKGAMTIQSRFCEIIFNWEHAMVAVYKDLYF